MSLVYSAKPVENSVAISRYSFCFPKLMCNYSSKNVDIDHNGLAEENDDGRGGNGGGTGDDVDVDNDDSDGVGDGDDNDGDDADDDDGDGDGEDGDDDGEDDDDNDYNKIENDIDCAANIFCFPWRCLILAVKNELT